MNDQKPIALWAVPRSISTAFERVFVERGDFKVFHEPFSASYYYSEDRISHRYANEEPKAEYNYENVLARLFESWERRVYFKDMALHAKGVMTPEFVSRFTNTFIIRNPIPVIASLNRFWPDFTLEETGYELQHRLFSLAVENGEEPAIVDAADLTENPEGVVAIYCESLGIFFILEALSWDPRKMPDWEMWAEWHSEAEESTGIKKEPLEDDTELPEGLEEVYEHCLPYYEELHEKRLRPTGER
jgi:Sulfotransferase domain